jgi:hypothetical protein
MDPKVIRDMSLAYAAVYDQDLREELNRTSKLSESSESDVGYRLGRGLVGSLRDLPGGVVAQLQGKTPKNSPELKRQAQRGQALMSLVTKGQLPGSQKPTSTPKPSAKSDDSTPSSSSFKWNPEKNIIAAKGGKLGIMDKGDSSSWREPNEQEKGEIPISSTEKFRSSESGQRFVKQRDAAKGAKPETSKSTPSASVSITPKPAPASQLSPGGRASNADLEGKTFPKRKTAGGTEYEVRTPTRAEMEASRKAGGGEAGVKAAVERSSKLMGGPEGSGEIKPDPTLKPITKSFSQTSTPEAPKPASAPAAPTPRPVGKSEMIAANIARARVPKPSTVSSGFDLFDVVMGHLLDEGYADTNEAAIAIMANMSEEWRESIVEAEVLAQKGGVPGSVQVRPALSIPGTNIGIGPNKPVPGTFTKTTPGQRAEINKGNTTIDRGIYQQPRVGAGPTSAERQRFNRQLTIQGNTTTPKMPM